jgi:predicted nucleotidyltransferase
LRLRGRDAGVSIESIESLQVRLREQAAAPSHLTRLAQLRALFEADAACIAAVLVGSFARGSGNRLSDLDLVAFTTRGDAQTFSDRADRVLATQDLLHGDSSRHVASGCFRKYVYLDFSSCELYAVDVDAPFRLYRPYLSVWDPSGYLAGREVEGLAPKHEDFEPYPHGDDGLIWELVDCIKWIKQGRVELAKNYLRKLGSKLQVDNEAVGTG